MNTEKDDGVVVHQFEQLSKLRERFRFGEGNFETPHSLSSHVILLVALVL